MTITPNDIYEPDIVEVICKVQSSLENIEIFLIKDRTVLKRAIGKHLIYRFTSKATDSGELVCKVEWKNVQRENYTTLTVKGKLSVLLNVICEPKLIAAEMVIMEIHICCINFVFSNRGVFKAPVCFGTCGPV